MNALLKKLNFKDHKQLYLLNVPESLAQEVTAFKEYIEVLQETDVESNVKFCLCFVESKEELNNAAKQILPKVVGDDLVWFAYPKKSSKNYKSDITRDDGWQIFGEFGFEPVRMIAIDKDWSALRFRHIKFIKKLTRNKKMRLTKDA